MVLKDRCIEDLVVLVIAELNKTSTLSQRYLKCVYNEELFQQYLDEFRVPKVLKDANLFVALVISVFKPKGIANGTTKVD